MEETKPSGGDVTGQKQAKKPSLVEVITANNIIGRWAAKGFIPDKYTVDRETGMVMFSKNVVGPWDAPWIYTLPDLNRNCEFYKELWQIWNFIPKKCLHCWKVVVVPKTIKQLFKVYETQLKMIDTDPFCFCKCGIEVRPDVERNYGAYYYNATLDAGLEKLDRVRDIIAREVSPDLQVYLKRGCTEYERMYGDSSLWDSMRTPEHDALELAHSKIFKLTGRANEMYQHVRWNVMEGWVAFAADRGDPTVAEINNGQKIFPGYVLYERECPPSQLPQTQGSEEKKYGE